MAHTRPFPKTVLVIEDEAIIRRAYMRLFSSYGASQVHCRADLEAARSFMVSDQIAGVDVVVMDFNLPDGNTDALYDEFRDRLNRYEIGVVVITGEPDAPELQIFKNDHVRVLSKSSDNERIVAALCRANRHGRSREAIPQMATG